MSATMRGMILAGGLSTRLYPLTLDVPKPLVPVLDRPVVDHVIDYLTRAGVDDITINVHYFAAAIEAYIGRGHRWNAHMRYLREPALMGSAGAVKQVQSTFDETFVVIGCDDVTDIDLGAAVAFHRARRAEATIVLAQAADVSQYGVVIIDGEGRITEFQEKPSPGTAKSDLVNTGVYVFEPALLDRIPAGTFYDFGRDVFPQLLAGGAAFYGMRQLAYWCDIGTPREYRRCHFDALNGKVALRPADGATMEGGVLRGAAVRIDRSARIVAPACIGAGSVLHPGALVERSILWKDVTVGAGAVVSEAVLGDGARVEAGSTVNGGEFGRDARIGL
ncbi:MAG TPA: NDP-sugar synthase [Candidatus Eremiobacteraceae bacterium]|nr:NDP-sugar synthase [Candidatus Eremiobacteraceae bacterium]